MALAVASCLPLEDLSGYKAASGSRSPEPPSDAEAVVPLQPGVDPDGQGEPGAGGGGSGETFPGTETPLMPGAAGTSSSVGAGGPCNSGASCELGDGGSTAIADAGTPPAVEPPPDAKPVPRSCSSLEATGPNGRCYVAVAAPLSWPDARVGCQNRGAGWDLATLRTRADSEFLAGVLPHEAWAGGADDVTEGIWAWVTDGAEFWSGEGAEGNALNGAFTNWFLDEPNGADSSDCLRILVDGTWADLECDEPRGSVCEGPPS